MLTSTAIIFEPVNDLIGMKVGVYREELGKRIVCVSPAIYSLLQGDEKPAVLQRLRVSTDKGMKWIMDMGEM